MENKKMSFLIAILFSVVSFAQIPDSTKVDERADSLKSTEQARFIKKLIISTDTIVPVQPIDSVRIVKLNDTINVIMRLDSLGVYKTIDSVRIPTKADLLKIKLDSLLRPFYTIQFDSVKNKDIYTPRFRMVINQLTNDTTYAPVPKINEFLTIQPKLLIDTLKIINPIRQVNIDTTKFAKDPIWWKNKNSFGLDISEAAFVNWNSGGNNSVSGLVKFSVVKSYKKLHLLWHNEIFARYGLNRQEEQGLRKTDDKLEVNSTFGYRKDTISNWYYSVKLNFNTQFTDGYKYPDTSSPISRLFAPAYLFLGAGTQYELRKNNFSIYLSPITLKSTFVLDQALSNDGAFGVAKGKRSRNEFGSLIQSTWDTEVFKNVTMSNRLSLYSDYLNNYGNIDINWELNFNLTINKHIKANIGTNLIYDDDIKFKDDIDNDGTLETFGARVQLKQLLGIGVLFEF